MGEALHISKECVGDFCLHDNLCNFYSVKQWVWSMIFNFCLSSHLLSRQRYLCLDGGLSPLGDNSLSVIGPGMGYLFCKHEMRCWWRGREASCQRPPLPLSHFMLPNLVSCSSIFWGVDADQALANAITYPKSQQQTVKWHLSSTSQMSFILKYLLGFKFFI